MDVGINSHGGTMEKIARCVSSGNQQGAVKTAKKNAAKGHVRMPQKQEIADKKS